MGKCNEEGLVHESLVFGSMRLLDRSAQRISMQSCFIVMNFRRFPTWRQTDLPKTMSAEEPICPNLSMNDYSYIVVKTKTNQQGQNLQCPPQHDFGRMQVSVNQLKKTCWWVCVTFSSDSRKKMVRVQHVDHVADPHFFTVMVYQTTPKGLVHTNSFSACVAPVMSMAMWAVSGVVSGAVVWHQSKPQAFPSKNLSRRERQYLELGASRRWKAVSGRAPAFNWPGSYDTRRPELPCCIVN